MYISPTSPGPTDGPRPHGGGGGPLRFGRPAPASTTNKFTAKTFCQHERLRSFYKCAAHLPIQGWIRNNVWTQYPYLFYTRIP